MAELPTLVASALVPDFRRCQCRAASTRRPEWRSSLRSYGFCGRPRSTAFGDGGNDVAMLRAAGVGVAMGNACDEALNAADYVTASVDDDGIAKALAHLGVI